jgi:hypothetical protein
MQASIGSQQSGNGGTKQYANAQYTGGNQTLSMGSMMEKPKITINLMDVSFLEQNLQ